jgi:hypothetical protein
VGNDNIPTGCFQHENGRNSTGRPGPNATLKFEQHLAKAKNTVQSFSKDNWPSQNQLTPSERLNGVSKKVEFTKAVRLLHIGSCCGRSRMSKHSSNLFLKP